MEDAGLYSILHIEDDPDNVAFVKTVLAADRMHEWYIDDADSLATGLETLRKRHWDCILLDLNVKDSNGLDTFIRLSAAVPDVPVVIYSALRDMELAIEAVRAGAQDYVVKDGGNGEQITRSMLYAIERRRLTVMLQKSHADLHVRNQELQQAREELQQERDLFVSGPVVLLERTLGSPDVIHYVSPNIMRYGYNVNDFIAGEKSFDDIIHPDDKALVQTTILNRIEKGAQNIEQEYRVVDVHGGVVWLNDVSRLFTQENGTIRMYSYLVDISPRRSAEQDLTTMETRLTSILEGISEAVFEIDVNGRITFISPAISKILGYTAEELIGLPMADFIAAEQRQEFLEKLCTGVANEMETHDFLMQQKTAAFRRVHLYCSRRLSPDNEPIIAGVISDVTEQRHMVDMFRAARKELQRYLDISEVVFLSLDVAGVITMINKKGCDILGYTEAQLIGEHWFDLCVPTEFQTRAKTAFTALLQGEYEEVEFFENAVQTRIGEQRWLRWRNTPIYDADGIVTGVLSSGEDITEKRMAEAEVRDSRELLELALWGGDLGAWEWDVENDVVSLNDRARQILGYENGDLPAYQTLREEIVPQEDLDRLRAVMDMHLKGNTPFYQAETWIICKNNEWKWILERGKIVQRSDTGQPSKVVGTILDLTERKYAEISIEDSEKKFRFLAENSSDSIWTCDAEWQLTFISPSIEYICGFTPEEVYRMGLGDMFIQGDFEQLKEKFLAHADKLKAGETLERGLRLELRMHRRKQEAGWVEVVAIPIFDHQKKLVSIHGNTRDIHNRKLAQCALQESEEKYRLLVENQTDLVVKIDMEGRFLFVSPSYCRLFGKTEEQLLGHTFIPMVHEDDRSDTLEAMKTILQPPHTAFVEQRALAVGGWRWLAWSETAIFDDNGEITAMVGVGRDITEKKMAEFALIDSEKRLRTVISNLPVILFSLNTDGIFTLSEGRGLEGLGLQPGQVVGQNIEEVYGDNAVILNDIRQVLQGKSLASIAEIEGKQYQTWYSPILDAHEKVQQVIGVAVDISDRVRTQRELDRHRNHLEELVEARTLELKRANEHLRRFRFALDSAADNISIIDPLTLSHVDINDSTVSSLGYARDELLTMRLTDIVPENEQQPVLSVIDDVLHDAVPEGVLETGFLRHDGRRIPVEMLIRKFSTGDNPLLVATVRDITRRMEIENALRESEAKYRNVLENAREGILVVQDLRIRFFNDEVLHLTGLDAETLDNLPLPEFIHPDDHELLRDQYEARLRGEPASEGYNLRMFDVQGTTKWIEVRDVAINWEDRPATLSFFNDITARKKSEEYIYFQASLLRIVGHAVIALDRNGHISYWNAHAEQMYGWTSEEVLGRSYDEFELFGREFATQVLPALYSSGAWKGEVERTHKNGSIIPVDSRWNIIRSEGEARGYVGVGIDLTERKKLERDLLQSQKLASLGILSEGIAHELRNPLGYASSAAQLLLTRQDLPEEQLRKYGEAIYTGVEKANQIIENLLLIGKPKGQMMKGRVDLSEIAAEALADFSSLPIAAGVEVSIDFAPDSAVIFGNREMLLQLFNNLFTNAANAMNGSGNIFVRGNRSDDTVSVRVSDTGPGIPAEIADSIFDPFFTTSRSDKGFGLGLTLCYFIVDDHDGSIELSASHSDTGEGAVFLLTFPLG